MPSTPLPDCGTTRLVFVLSLWQPFSCGTRPPILSAQGENHLIFLLFLRGPRFVQPYTLPIKMNSFLRGPIRGSPNVPKGVGIQGEQSFASG